jgi:hypothetical protein
MKQFQKSEDSSYGLPCRIARLQHPLQRHASNSSVRTMGCSPARRQVLHSCASAACFAISRFSSNTNSFHLATLTFIKDRPAQFETTTLVGVLDEPFPVAPSLLPWNWRHAA